MLWNLQCRQTLTNTHTHRQTERERERRMDGGNVRRRTETPHLAYQQTHFVKHSRLRLRTARYCTTFHAVAAQAVLAISP